LYTRTALALGIKNSSIPVDQPTTTIYLYATGTLQFLTWGTVEKINGGRFFCILMTFWYLNK
jgi:hypothetical protein